MSVLCYKNMHARAPTHTRTHTHTFHWHSYTKHTHIFMLQYSQIYINTPHSTSSWDRHLTGAKSSHICSNLFKYELCPFKYATRAWKEDKTRRQLPILSLSPCLSYQIISYNDPKKNYCIQYHNFLWCLS